MKTEIVVRANGRFTIPVGIRRKYGIEEGTLLRMVETESGVLLRLRKSK